MMLPAAGRRSPGGGRRWRPPLMVGFTLARDEKADLIAFLTALTDHGFLENPDHQSPFQ